MKSLVFKTCAVTALGLLSVQSNAATVSADIEGMNDCPGAFSGGLKGFNNCVVAIDGVALSSVIAKYEVDDSGLVASVQTNDALYPGIDGSEFMLDYSAGVFSSGTWSYDGTVPDPNVRFWTAKAGNAFRLFWTVDDAELLPGGACDSSTFNLACMQAAQHVTGGNWTTPGDRNLSHITFYNSGIVPIPAAVWLFGTGLLGLVSIAGRRRA